jgi:phosphoglycolate phosphatase
MRYKLVIFDFDGTLANSFPWAASIINQVAEKYKFRRIYENEYETLRSYDIGSALKFLGIPLWKAPAIGSHLRKLMAHDIQQIPLFDGIDRLLQRLSGDGITLAVVSSNSRQNICRVLGPENAALITYYECGVAIFGKSAKLRKVLRHSGILSGDAIYIGDEIRDIEAARDADMAFGAASWGYTRADSLEAHSPWTVFAHTDEIYEKIACT